MPCIGSMSGNETNLNLPRVTPSRRRSPVPETWATQIYGVESSLAVYRPYHREGFSS